MIEKARNCGWELQVSKNEPIKHNLEKVIKSLEEQGNEQKDWSWVEYRVQVHLWVINNRGPEEQHVQEQAEDPDPRDQQGRIPRILLVHWGLQKQVLARHWRLLVIHL